MESLNIEATKSSPRIDFDAENGALQIEGESYPENAAGFYKPVIDWVKRFMAENRRRVTVDIRVRYLNTSSSKCMMMLLDVLEEAHERKQITVNWHYEKGNDMAREFGMEFGEDLDMPYHVIEET